MAKKSETDTPTPATPPALVTVRVLSQAVCEDGIHHAKGESFQTTAERADALSSLVEIVTEN